MQIFEVDEYRALSEDQNSRGVVLPAKRGNIYARDYRTDELFPLAQNSTTYTIFADPMLLDSGSEAGIADLLLPLLWEAQQQLLDEDEEIEVELSVEEDEEKEDLTAEVIENPEEEVDIQRDSQAAFRNRLISKLTTKDVVRRELYDIGEAELQLVMEAFLPGVGVDGEILTINPALIDNPEDTATKLATILATDYDNVYPLMIRKKVRYVKLLSKVSSDIRDEIEALGIRGIGSIAEYRRIYPEGELAAQVVGFLNHDEEGAYGVEGSYNDVLAGEDGLRKTQVDPLNRQITVGDITIENAEDGNSVVLTIDRAIQEVAERELAAMVDSQRADSGQVIVMEPYTGAILALAHYPTYNPNEYGDVYEMEELVKHIEKHKNVDAEGNVIEVEEEIWETAEGEKITTEWGVDYIIRDSYRFPVYSEYDAEGKVLKKVIYANRLGEGVFALKAATDPYEPGSVFKPIVMSMALDAGEVTPTTKSIYNSPVQLDEMLRGKPITIKNAEGSYHGMETMTEVIENSSNIGMTFVAEQLGKATFYDYLVKFGFGERSGVDFEGEDAGSLANYTKWTLSETITKAFGQGITTNLFQMAAAYSALANGGLLMKPYIVDEEITPDGEVIKHEAKTIRRVIDAETSATITQMLVASVEEGLAVRGGVEGYFVAGKTGTSQTYLRGKALNDLGTTITAFGGYAPATNPKFIMIVKIDRPRVSEWGASTAAPVFHAVAEEMLTNYFAIPPKED